GRTALPPLDAAAGATLLAPPRLPAAAASLVPVARRAGAAVVPVLLAVPAAAGRLLLARALHADAGRGGPLVAASGRRPPLGDLAELEMVLARAFLLAPSETIEVEHLGLEAPSAHVAPEEPRHDTGAELEFLLAELAHELRNPLVTIKTFAQHLPALLDDAELRQRFAGLAEEAIGRMDDLLENALQFARLTTPRKESIEVGPLLDRVLAEVTPELAGREVRVRQATAPG